MTYVLLLVDVQKDMLAPPEPVPDADRVGPVIAETLAAARAAGATIVHIRNNGGADDPDAPGAPGWQLVHEVRPGEHVIDKYEMDAFAGTPLADLLTEPTDVVVAGLQSQYCVRATSLAALERGHRVSLVHGAHSTYDEGDPAAEISRQVETELAKAGVSIVDAAPSG